MLAFPQRVLAGDVPNADFLHLYGPGSLWALAGVFEVFGDTLATERLFGLLQHAGIVFGIFAIARPWGRRLATACALVALVVIIGPIGLTALAWNGAVALGVCGLAVGLAGRRRAEAGETRSADRRLLGAGLLAGLALLFRPDLVVAVSLGYGAMAWGLGRDRLKWLVGRRPRHPLALPRAPGPSRDRRRLRGHVHRAGVPAPRRPLPAPPALVGRVRRLPPEGGRGA